MSSNKVGLLNYCLWARLEFINISKLNKNEFPKSASVFEAVASMLDVFQKFILPNKAELLDRFSIKQAHLDLTRLPYPITAFEAPWTDTILSYTTVPDESQRKCSKRIALCWEAGQGHGFLRTIDDEILKTHPDGGIQIMSIFWDDESEHWQVGHCGLFLPYGSSFQPYDESAATTVSENIRHLLKDSTKKVLNADVLKVYPVVFCKEVFDVACERYGGADEVLSQAILDTNDELNMLIQSCALLNCENIETDELITSPKLNAKRRQQGKPEFYDYRTLTVTNLASPQSSKAMNGKKGKVRMHLRRGHIRRLPDRNIWVRDAVIAKDSKKGVVSKEYVLKN